MLCVAIALRMTTCAILWFPPMQCDFDRLNINVLVIMDYFSDSILLTILKGIRILRVQRLEFC
jgi:hypothetical protein